MVAAVQQTRDSPFDLRLPQTFRGKSAEELLDQAQNLLDAVKQLSTEVVPYIVSAVSNGTINPGDAINLFNSAGTLKAKQAKSNTILCSGIYIGKKILAANDPLDVQLGGIFEIEGAGFTPAAVQYLDTATAGNLIEAAPAAGSIQRVGIAYSSTLLLIRPEYVFS